MNDLNSIIARAKRAKLLEMENDQLRAEIEKLQAECRAYRQLVAQCQEDETNRRALEQAKKRAAAEGMMGPLPLGDGKFETREPDFKKPTHIICGKNGCRVG